MKKEKNKIEKPSIIIDRINRTLNKINDPEEYVSSLKKESLKKHKNGPPVLDLLLELEKTNISLLKKYLNISEKSVVLFVFLFENTFKGKRIGLFDLSEKCGGYALLSSWMPFIKELLLAGLIVKIQSRYNDDVNFKVSTEILESILFGKPSVIVKNEGLNNLAFLKLVKREFLRCEKGKGGGVYDMWVGLKNLIKLNDKLPVCSFILNNQLTDEESIFLLRCCYLKVFGDGGSYISTLNEMINEEEQEFVFMIDESFVEYDFIELEHKLIDGTSLLIKNDIIQPRRSGVYRESGVYEVSYNGIELLLSDVVSDEYKRSGSIKKSPFYSVVEPNDINKEELIYSDNVLKSLRSIEKLLSVDNLFVAFDKCKSLGLKEKITVMLRSEGFGTGKSSWVKQLGRLTGRKVFEVKISSLKSSYFAESEKNLQELFSSYNNHVEEIINLGCETEDNMVPILFMDEISSLFVSRKFLSGNDNSGVTNTLHELSNIILTNLDNFKGILICTSNMFSKSGYELEEGLARRFTIKLNIDSPNSKVRLSIIKNNLSHWLSENQMCLLSEKYTLTGGQIKVIKERLITDEIIGNNIDYDLIVQYFETESFGWSSTNNKCIGFN